MDDHTAIFDPPASGKDRPSPRASAASIAEKGTCPGCVFGTHLLGELSRPSGSAGQNVPRGGADVRRKKRVAPGAATPRATGRGLLVGQGDPPLIRLTDKRSICKVWGWLSWRSNGKN